MPVKLVWLFLFALACAHPQESVAIQAPATAQGADCSSCAGDVRSSSAPHPSRPPQPQSNPGASSAQAVGSMMNYINQWQQLNDQVESENKAAEQRRHAEQQRAIAVERERLLNQDRAERGGTAPSNTPQGLWDKWEENDRKGTAGTAPSSGYGGENPWGNSGAASAVKDPDLDYAGEPCFYFTRLSTDGSTFVNAYADGSFVIYGRYGYECVGRRWVNKGAARIFTNPEKYDAAKLEGGR